MQLAAIDWLSISIHLLLVAFVVVCLLMTLMILMQRPKQEGLGAAFGGGVTDQVFGARTTNVLQRGTVYLGSLFFILSLTLAVLIGHQNRKTSLLKSKEEAAKVEETVPAAPAEDALPKSLTEELPVEQPATGEQPVTGEQPAPEAQPPTEGQPAPEAQPAPADSQTPPSAEGTPATGEASTEPAAETPPQPAPETPPAGGETSEENPQQP